MSASHAKISLQLRETVEPEEIYQENWTKLKGRLIVSGERLQEGWSSDLTENGKCTNATNHRSHVG